MQREFYKEILKENIAGIILSVLSGTLSIGFNIALMGLAAYIISRAAYHPELYMLMPYITGVRFFGTFRGVLRYVERLYSHRIALKIVAEIRVWFFKHMDRRFPYMKNTSSILYSEMINDVSAIENILVKVVLPVGIALLVYLATAIFIFLYFDHYSFSLLYLVFIGMLIFVLPFWGYLILSQKGKVLKKKEKVFEKFLIRSFSVLPEVVLYSGGNLVKNSFMNHLKHYEEASFAMKQKNNLYHSIQFLFMHLFIVSLFIFEYEFHGLLTTSFAVLILVILSGFEIIMPVFSGVSYYSYYYASVLRLAFLSNDSNFFNYHKIVKRKKCGNTEKPIISIENLFFRYEESQPWILKNIRLKLQKNKIVVVTGASGSGKSTMLSLLSSEIIPQKNCYKGRIILREPSEGNKSGMAVYTPKSYFFNDDIIFNTSFNSYRKNESDIMLKKSDDALLKKLNLDSGELKQKGKSLKKSASFGQKKRILLARAFRTSAQLLLLDEPTEGLDIKIRMKINGMIKKLKHKRAILIITHKLELLEIADEIFNLKNGRLVRVR